MVGSERGTADLHSTSPEAGAGTAKASCAAKKAMTTPKRLLRWRSSELMRRVLFVWNQIQRLSGLGRFVFMIPKSPFQGRHGSPACHGFPCRPRLPRPSEEPCFGT